MEYEPYVPYTAPMFQIGIMQKNLNTSDRRKKWRSRKIYISPKFFYKGLWASPYRHYYKSIQNLLQISQAM